MNPYISEMEKAAGVPSKDLLDDFMAHSHKIPALASLDPYGETKRLAETAHAMYAKGFSTHPPGSAHPVRAAVDEEAGRLKLPNMEQMVSRLKRIPG